MTELKVLLTALPIAALANAILVWVAAQERASTHSQGYRICARVRLWALVVSSVALLVLLVRLAPFILNAVCSTWDAAAIAPNVGGLLNLEILGAALAVWAITHYFQFIAWRMGHAAAISAHPACHWTRLAAITASFLSFVVWVWLYMPTAFRSLCLMF